MADFTDKVCFVTGGANGIAARACLFLADTENDFIDGVNLVVDGGMTRKMIYTE